MPEGPEIRLAADRVASVLVDRPLREVFFAFPELQRYCRSLAGRRVVSVDTHGKAMLTRFDNGKTMYSHNQLYGRWYVSRSGKRPDTGRQLRVALHTDQGAAFLYSASEIAVLGKAELARHPFLSRLGPDILDAELDARQIVDRLRDDRFARRGLGALYLDQGFLAGLGNYLRSEILFFAKLNHASRPSGLAQEQCHRLGRQTLLLARRSYKTRGLTNPPALVAQLKAAGKSRGQYRFAVFGRQGQPCHTCQTCIVRTDVSGRRLYYCPGCQPG